MSKTILYSDVPSKPAKLFIIDKTGNVSEVLLPDKITIGRSEPGNSVGLKLNSSIVSRLHGEIVSLGGDYYYYRDLESTNGTFINDVLYGKGNGNNRLSRKLEDGDIIRIGPKSNNIPHPDTVIMIFSTGYIDDSIWYTQPISANIAEINIGRNTFGNQNVRIENEMVSQNHASFFLAQQGWAIKDHDSTNGVYVNGQRISKPMYLNKNDVVRIVNMFFMFLGDRFIFQNYDQKKNTASGSQLVINITERSVWQKFKKLTLLQNINLSINSGEMVLILGGSGAGKTTFMNAVMGYEKADGKIFHGQTDIYNDYDSMKYEIGFVPQQDLLRGSDTVYDTLSNAAQMKLPKRTTAEKRKERIEEVLELLGLQRERESLVTKLSGGQRKRLSIAVEFISNPSLFFLDEPDSGLDGIMAMELNKNLRTIADTGKIVMVITHSPDRVAKLYNKVIVLAKSARDNCGHLAFYGSIKDALSFFETESLEGIVKRINRPDEGGDGKSDFYIQKYTNYKG